MTIAAVTGLEAEARIARGAGFAAMASGADAARAAALAERLLEEGAMALVSFGVAGALAPGLAAGTILLPRRVLSHTGDAFAADSAWHGQALDALRAHGIDAIEGDVVGATRIVVSPEAKSALYRRTGAAAVDLESGAAAAAARHAGRPFLALRAVADPSEFALPAAALVGVDAAGRTALLPVLLSILHRPGQIADLVRLARHTRRALDALARAAPALRDLSPPPGRR